MYTIVLIVHFCLCAFLIMVVLLQQGKGADAGAAFGGGSNTLFGASGASGLLIKVTTICAGLFMLTSILLVKHYPESLFSTTSSDPLAGSSVGHVAESPKDNPLPVAATEAKPATDAK